MNVQAIAIVRQGGETSPTEHTLQQALNLPLVSAEEAATGFHYQLRLEAGGLTLHASADNGPAGLRVDFSSSRLDQRAQDRLRKQNLVRAVGIKTGINAGNKPAVLDATAGLGTDAFLLASAGCQVQMLERSAVVHALLLDALNRGMSLQEDSLSLTLSRMSLLQADFMDAPIQAGVFDVIYLDPMFPQTGKSARAKKPMFLLQGLLGHGEDGAALLERAMLLAARRVVVKRGKLSASLGQRPADICFRGNSNRFDVYLVP
jgi:16S rRNA (guanine1516-N2)-methyltransferase